MEGLFVLLPQQGWNYNKQSAAAGSNLWLQTETTVLPCGWLTNVVTQKLGILAMSSDLFWKNGWRNLLYFCSTFRISSLACSFNLENEPIRRRRGGKSGDRWRRIKTHLSISFCTSSMCSIASCCSFSANTNRQATSGVRQKYHPNESETKSLK